MENENSNPLEIDDILSQITMLFSANADRESIAGVNRGLRTNVTMNRAMRARAMMQGAVQRFRLTKFPPVTSMDQKIREVVPPFWILATAMSNHATARDRRGHASAGAEDRFEHLDHDFRIDTPEYRRRQAEGYFHVQYKYRPDDTLQEYFQDIANNNNLGNSIDVTRFFNDTAEQTATELLMLTFTRQELSDYGW